MQNKFIQRHTGCKDAPSGVSCSFHVWEEKDCQVLKSVSAMGRSQEKASSAVLLRMLHEDEKLLAAAEKNRCGESLEALASRFATTAATADKAFAQMRMDLEYREKHDLLALAERPARQLFPSSKRQRRHI